MPTVKDASLLCSDCGVVPGHYHRPPAHERFAANVMPEPMSGCHLWMGVRGPDGYGQMYANGRTEKMHRLAWILAYGDIPPGAMVLHRCDTPPCVNPEHLFLGNKKINNVDTIRKGRWKGRYAQRVTPEIVQAIRRLKGENGVTEVARQFGIGASHVHAIWVRKLWAHVPDEIGVV